MDHCNYVVPKKCKLSDADICSYHSVCMEPNYRVSTLCLYDEDGLQWSYVEHWESGKVHVLFDGSVSIYFFRTLFLILEVHLQD